MTASTLPRTDRSPALAAMIAEADRRAAAIAQEYRDHAHRALVMAWMGRPPSYLAEAVYDVLDNDLDWLIDDAVKALEAAGLVFHDVNGDDPTDLDGERMGPLYHLAAEIAGYALTKGLMEITGGCFHVPDHL